MKLDDREPEPLSAWEDGGHYSDTHIKLDDSSIFQRDGLNFPENVWCLPLFSSYDIYKTVYPRMGMTLQASNEGTFTRIGWFSSYRNCVVDWRSGVKQDITVV
jgi:hypothetical protein